MAYSQKTFGQLKTNIRQELMDPTARWWSEGELNYYLDLWQNDLQQEMELVWAQSQLVTSTATITLANIAPPMARLDAVYYNNYRLSGRLLQDLEVLDNEWRSADPDMPRCVVQYDSTQMVLWPPLSTSGTLTFEYPKQLSIPGDSSFCELPVWAQFTAKPYVCARAYLRPGPTNDIKKATRYQAQYDRAKIRAKKLWAGFAPERFRKLKPAGKYEYDILTPPPGFEGLEVSVATTFQDYIPTGTIDGSNRVFTLPVVPVEMQVFLNGVLQHETDDFTWDSGYTITFNEATTPQTGDLLIVWVFRS